MAWPEYTPGRRGTPPQWTEGSEPLADALLYEPVPYRSALKENCTHVIVLRTRADDERVTVKQGLLEKIMVSRFFGRKHNLPDLVDWMHNQACDSGFNVCLYYEGALYFVCWYNFCTSFALKRCFLIASASPCINKCALFPSVLWSDCAYSPLSPLLLYSTTN